MRLKQSILTLALCAVCIGQAGALNYTFDAPDNYTFGRSTSVDIVHRETESANIDRSKNVALIPPGFGTPTSYLPGSGEYLTPNLVPGALNGGLVNSIFNTGYTGTSRNYATVTESTGTVIQYPDVNSFTWTYEPYYSGNNYNNYNSYYGVSFTDVTDDLYYKNGHLGKSPPSALIQKFMKGHPAINWQRASGILQTPVSGTEMYVLRRTIAEPTPFLDRFTRWKLEIKSPSPQSWERGIIPWSA